MPAKVAPASQRDALGRACSTFANSRLSTLPVWDEAQVAQENWGGPLTVPLPNSAGVGGSGGVVDGAKEPKPTNGKSKSLPGGGGGVSSSSTAAAEPHYDDEATRHGIEAFVAAYCPPPPPSPQAAGAEGDAARETPSTGGITWRRPADVFRPFRPVVHCNATPFMNPYAAADALIPVDAKPEEARCRTPSSTGAPNASSTTHRRSGAGARQSDTAGVVPEAFHQLYPEAVSVMDMFTRDEREGWLHCTPTESVRRYRAVPALMQPYDSALVAGCAETPAQACASRYSTGLRHKLKQAEQLAALTEAPPFLMSAFNSAMLAVEQAQRYVPEGAYLWELVYPHAPGTCHPVYNPFGKYAVKLFIDGAHRKVLVDDALPVDVLGRPLLSTTSRKELWPCLLAKAVVKALGPVSGVQALSSAPELIVAALMGNWVPQYLSPRQEAVTATALLLLYQRQLTQLASLEGPFAQDGGEDAASQGGADGAADGAARDGKGGARDRRGSPNTSQRKRGQSTGPRSGSVKRHQSGRGSAAATADASDDGASPRPLRATEYCDPVIDEPLPEQPLYICGLHAPAAAAAEAATSAAVPEVVGGRGTGPQLYTIHAMRPFRNTVALLLHTTPCSSLAEGVFDAEKEADDVCAIRHGHPDPARGARHAVAATEVPHGPERPSFVGLPSVPPEEHSGGVDMIVMDGDRAASVSSCWLTLEEFMTHMETIVVWRKLAGRYANAVSVSGESLLQHNGDGGATGAAAAAAGDTSPSAAARKKAPAPRRGEAAPTAAGAAASGTNSSVPPSPAPPPSPPLTMWWKLTTEKAVEAVVVVSSPALTEATSAATAAPTATSPSSSHPRRSVKPAEASTTTAEAPEEVATASQQQQRCVHFHHFQWDRAEPLNRIGALTYTSGALCSTVLHFRPGVHLIRVDLHRVQAPDKITFLSDAAIEVQLDLSHDASRDGFACVTDAGAYPAVRSCDTETVWLKRVFSLAAPTWVTLQLSTLDAGEDVTAHRQIHTIANRSSTAASGGKGGGNHGKAVAGARGGSPGAGTAAAAGAAAGKAGGAAAAAASGAGAADGKRRGDGPLSADVREGAASLIAARDANMSILRFTSLLLVNLDRPADYCVGTAGRLVKLLLEPNEKGYLVMAYTNVPALLLTSVQQHEDEAADDDGETASLLPSVTPLDSPPEEDLQPMPPPSPYHSSSAVGFAGAPSLFPAGQWKLTLRSNVELQSFDAVAHDLNNVTVEADLPRGGSPVLFRRTCTVTETTHVSIVAHLRSPVPMPYTIRIVRLSAPPPPPPPTVPTSATPRAVRTASSNSMSLGVSESPTVDAGTGGSGGGGGVASSRGSVLVVYESPLTHQRLFTADVLLSAAADVGGGKGAKGPAAAGAAGAGATVYAIEAAVSDEDAAAWDERCRRGQESNFLEYRESAEEQAAVTTERDIADYYTNPTLFLQRRREVSAQRRQLASEVAEKVMSRSATPGNSTVTTRKRSSSARRPSHRLSAALETFVKDSFRRQSSSMLPDAAFEAAVRHRLDTVDRAAGVRISVHFSFSSARAEVKVDTPTPDALAELRRHMRETVAWLQEWSEPGSSGVETAAAANLVSPSSTATSSGGKSAAPRVQREAAAAAATMEDALRAEAARQSRLEYLRNPQHLFQPTFDAGDGPDGAGTPAVAAAAAALAGRAKHDTSGSGGGGGASAGAGAGGGAAHVPGANMAGTASGARVHRKESAQMSAGTSTVVLDEAQSAQPPPPVLTQDGPATLFRFAAPLQLPQYRVELLPLRTWEESPSLSSQGKDGTTGAGAAAVAAGNRGKRPKMSNSAPAAAAAAPARAQGSGPAAASSTASGSSIDGVATGFIAAAAAAATTLSCPLTAAECEVILLPLRRPLVEATENCDLAQAQSRVLKSEAQLRFKRSVHAFFEAAAEQKAVKAAAASGEVGGIALPIVYHSLLGAKEEELCASLKSRKSFAFT
ncbi:hypothetical protein NESM_000016000 [Novymonas esmeraldas]|uniref:Calpain catalytic domain-containing protein n=1 Tax=Novymonas esmeraldas TaxID=1808958 RepID=A0AAW0F1K5_9TRYP